MRQAALRLYKDLLRYGENLKFTDKKYFRSRVRQEFLRNRPLTDAAKIQFQLNDVDSYSSLVRDPFPALQKGQKLLENRRVV